MPVTAKFSEEFYERLGHGVANEIVDWFNQVDLAYKTELKGHNEKNFQRFEAVLGAEIAGVNARMDGIEARLNKKIEAEAAGVRAEVAAAQANILRWMIPLFLGTALTVIGLG